jgi:anti-anti-sigma factor
VSPQRLSIELVHHPGVTEVKPSGELDIASSEDLERTVRREAEKADSVVIDLGRLDILDSSGLRSLIILFQESKARGWTLRLRHGPPSVQRVFEITRTAEILPFA